MPEPREYYLRPATAGDAEREVVDYLDMGWAAVVVHLFVGRWPST
jgi:hypothetical protein